LTSSISDPLSSSKKAIDRERLDRFEFENGLFSLFLIAEEPLLDFKSEMPDSLELEKLFPIENS
jgi:hypothetical protein